MLDHRKAEQAPSLLAYFLRECRDRAGLSRAQVAVRGNISASSIEKWELQGNIPTPDSLAGWFLAVNPPEIYRDKILSLTLQKMFPKELGQQTSTARIDEHDLRHLDALPHPACYHDTAVYDIAAANDAFYQRFQGLKQLDALVDGPPNLLVWQIRHPSARVLIGSWYDRTHVMLTRFRIEGPGSAPTERIEEIIAACQQAPEFDAMWQSDPGPELFNDPTLTLLGDDAAWHHYTVRTYGFGRRGNPLSLFAVVPTGN
ncbi:helix-turn-helix domain-containing protein [Nocardia carnea]|uniref:helix-turn-helix domain-containing protein n=1 Tax=Nocardia carnea TaxID=37328 RepID=UPI0024544248|nr:helix-turn-helix domain-containing protein [Nocardia carnea]